MDLITRGRLIAAGVLFLAVVTWENPAVGDALVTGLLTAGVPLPPDMGVLSDLAGAAQYFDPHSTVRDLLTAGFVAATTFFVGRGVQTAWSQRQDSG